MAGLEPNMQVEADTQSAASRDRSREMILVVDDSRVQRRILCMTLRKRGFRVLEASDGAEALRAVRDHPIEMVICDWMMPGMTGPELCHALRRVTRDRYLYIVLLTTKSEKGEIASGLEAGADDYLCKPVNATELVARIKAARRILAVERELTQKNALISKTLAELEILHEGIDRDLREARKLQQSLVRRRNGRFGDAEVSLFLEPSGHVGGDLVGFFRVNAREIGLYALDVSGHGISSALMTARLAGFLSGSTPGQNLAIEKDGSGMPVARDPVAVAQDLNTLLLNEMETEHYFTMFLSIFEVETGHLRAVQAGHPTAIHMTRAGQSRYFGSGGLPIGLIDGATYQEVCLDLEPGDRLVFPSDGFTECPDPAGALLDDDGLAAMMQRRNGLQGDQFLSALYADLEGYAAGKEFGDDVSALVLDFRR